MKTIVVTGASGDYHQRMADVTSSLTERWAKSHGYDFRVCSLEGDLPPSWHKIDALLDAFAGGYEQALWVDCDVATLPTVLSPFSEMEPHHRQGLVVHRTECGDVPNCGVWATRASLSSDLKLALGMSSHLRDNPWWEQSAVMQLMGFIPSVNPGESRFYRRTNLLDATAMLHPRWNWHPSDAGSCSDASFYHITQRWGSEERIEQLRRLACRWK